MSTSLDTNHRGILQRPYWLALVLALFLAGQVASSAHWHEAAKQLDADCALCMLSSANGAAAIASGWQPLAVTVCGFIYLLCVAAPRRSAVRFHDSRAPPFSPRNA